MRVQYFSVRRHQCRRLRGVGSGRTGSVRGVNDRSWGGFLLPGALHPPRVPTPAPCTPFVALLSPCALPFLHSPLLYARARCGRRRRLGQVRLSLGFNIGENTGFYLIARYVLCPVLRGEIGFRGVVESARRNGTRKEGRGGAGAGEKTWVHSGNAYTHWFP